MAQAADAAVGAEARPDPATLMDPMLSERLGAKRPRPFLAIGGQTFILLASGKSITFSPSALKVEGVTMWLTSGLTLS